MEGPQKQNMLLLLGDILKGKTFQQQMKELQALSRYQPTYEHDEKYKIYMKEISTDLLKSMNGERKDERKEERINKGKQNLK